MKEGDNYCGLDCSELLDELDGILKQCTIHSKYDPVFAPIMIDKLIARCEEAKSLLLTGPRTTTTTTIRTS